MFDRSKYDSTPPKERVKISDLSLDMIYKLKDSIETDDWTIILNQIDIPDYILVQAHNITWEAVANSKRGISYNLFRLLTGLSVTSKTPIEFEYLAENQNKKRDVRTKLNEVIKMYKYQFLDINWSLFARKTRFGNSLQLDKFLTLISDKAIFKVNDISYLEIYNALLENSFLKEPEAIENKEVFSSMIEKFARENRLLN